MTAPKSVKSPLTEMLDIFVPLTHAQKAFIAHLGSPKRAKPSKKRPTFPPPCPGPAPPPAKTVEAASTPSSHTPKPVHPPPAHAPKDNAGRSTSKHFRAVLDSVLPTAKPPATSPTASKGDQVEAGVVPEAVARAQEKKIRDRSIFESYLVIPAATRLKIWLAVGAFAAFGLYAGDRLVPAEDDAVPQWAGRRAPPSVSMDAAGRDRVVQVGR
ncbi:voltage gated chloride channel domain-containing protein [Rhodotorula toruloides]|uniref:Voltage gated chloride channel domain-containing protein n=1 Tax=Rhodotorula toruloides TaxID=5286 RepID=A0A511KF34_RHOTO|nr:voltage gated chloride channel domain-containing protein [Rhodotorula toruloides]